MMITTPAGIQGARLCALKGALNLEVLGLRNSRGSVYALVKREFGFKGSKARVLEQLTTHIEKFNKENGFT